MLKKDYHTHKKDMEGVCKEKEVRETEMSDIKEKYEKMLSKQEEVEKNLSEERMEREDKDQKYHDALEQINLLQLQNQRLEEDRAQVEKDRRSKEGEQQHHREVEQEMHEQNQELVERLRMTET